MEPVIFQYPGNTFSDDRGHVTFVNDFSFDGVKRFYQVQNHRSGFIRAWHGHKIEGKYVYVVKGSILIGCVKGEGDVPYRAVLSDKVPKVLWIPPGNYNGFMTLTDETIVQFFSTSTLAESKGDDYREPWDKWNIWDIEYR